MAGDRDVGSEQDIRKAGLWDRFSFLGFVPDAVGVVRSCDAFGYLLNPEHYGTTENVLLEAMACGLPPVVLKQNAERYIVPPFAGYLVETPEEYGERIAYLWQYPEERYAVGYRARAYVIEHYRIEENMGRFRSACVQARRKSSRDFSVLGDTPWEWFLFCLDSETKSRFECTLEKLRYGGPAAHEDALQMLRLCPLILWEKRKSSLRHFSSIYLEDNSLQHFSQLMEEIEHGDHKTEL